MTLISRLEQAEAGDRELDLDLWWELKARRGSAKEPMPEDYRASNLRMNDAPHYTTSIDAAMSLVPEGFLMFVTNVGAQLPQEPVFGRATAIVGKWDDISRIHPTEASTPALALCVASLKAAGYE